MERYPQMFSPSTRCRPPHLNVDVLRDDLYQAKIVDRLQLRSSAELLAKIDATHLAIGEQIKEEWAAFVKLPEDSKEAQAVDKKFKGKQYEQALKKATANSFYLGLVGSEWMSL